MRAIVKAHSSSSIGSIKESMLTEAQFQAIHGLGWVLMDGRDVTGSDYATLTGNTTLPDARGQFLRGKNNNRIDGNQDPDGERVLGAYQADENKQHNHRAGMGQGTASPSYSRWIETGGDGANVFEGYSSIAIENTGGNESRPKNVAVNIFIKINEA